MLSIRVRCLLQRQVHFCLSSLFHSTPVSASSTDDGGESSSSDDEATNGREAGFKTDGPDMPIHKMKQLLDTEAVNAVENVTNSMHSDQTEAKSRMQNDLLKKLLEHERHTYDSATSAARDEAADVAALLRRMEVVSSDAGDEDTAVKDPLSGSTKTAEGRATEKADAAPDRRYGHRTHSLKSSGSSTRLSPQLRQRLSVVSKGIEKASPVARAKLRRGDDGDRADASDRPPTRGQMLLARIAARRQQREYVLPPILDGSRLGIFDKDKLAAVDQAQFTLPVWSQLLRERLDRFSKVRPRSDFDDMVELTKEQKLWPYPIDNEWQMEEKEVPFSEHVFIERLLEAPEFPKAGPIRQFMEMVCIGLSKNPYMDIQKKRDHIEWYRNYFADEQIRSDIEKLHEQDMQKRKELSKRAADSE